MIKPCYVLAEVERVMALGTKHADLQRLTRLLAEVRAEKYWRIVAGSYQAYIEAKLTKHGPEWRARLDIRMPEFEDLLSQEDVALLRSLRVSTGV
jgi:hypothetical protein